MKSILVFRSAALGDFVLSVPALQKLREIFPDKKIVLLSIQTSDKKLQQLVATYAGGLTSTPWIKMVMPHLVDDVVVIESVRNWRSLLDVYRQLTKHKFDAAVLMLDICSPWMGRIKKLLLLRVFAGWIPIYGWRAKGSLNGDVSKLKRLGHLRHHVHGPLQFMAELPTPRAYSDEDLKFDLRPGPDAEAWALAWISTHVQFGQRLIAVAPGSLQPHKQWPIELFKQLLLALLERYADLHVVVLGSPKDLPLGQALENMAPDRVSNLAGITSITQSAALLKFVHLLVGNDGGAMHLGDAMGCKVISIVPGIEYPDSIEPWHNKALAIRWPVECAPCYSFSFCPKGHNKCMVSMPLSYVLDKCVSVL